MTTQINDRFIQFHIMISLGVQPSVYPGFCVFETF